MNAKELLTSLQIGGRTYYSNSEFLNKNREELKSEEYKGVIKLIEDSNKRMPTDYQDSHFYNIIEDSFDSLSRTMIEKDIEFKGIKIYPERIPLFGTADFEGYNAFVEAEDKIKVIVFNNDLLKFTQQIMEIYTKEHWLTSKGLINKDIKKIFAQHFCDVMLCYHIFSDAYATVPLAFCEISDLDYLGDQDKIYELSSSIDELIDFDQYYLFESQIRIPTYQWIAAHEYAHVVLGHLNSNFALSKLNLCGNDIAEISFSYQKEYEADLLGAIITLESDESLFSANGICLAMNCILLSQLYEESERSLSHPPIQYRIEKVFSYIENSKQFLVSNYENVDKIIASNYYIYRKVINKIMSEEMLFVTPIEMQKFIYKNCDVFDNDDLYRNY